MTYFGLRNKLKQTAMKKSNELMVDEKGNLLNSCTKQEVTGVLGTPTIITDNNAIAPMQLFIYN